MRTVSDLQPGEKYRDVDGIFTVISHDSDGATTVERGDGKRWALVNPEHTKATPL